MARYINTLKVTDKILLDPPVWDDVRIPGLTVRLAGDSPDLETFGAGTLKAFAFAGAGAIVEQAFFTIQLPHSYKHGTDINPHVHWTPTTNDAGNVVWSIDYSWANKDGTFGAETSIDSTALAAGGTAWVHKYSAFAAITGTGKEISSMLVCRIYRDPAHGSDTYEHDASLLEIDFHFEVDTLGSRLGLVKQ